MRETLLQEGLISRLGQDGASSSRHGKQAGPAAEKLAAQLQADVSCCQLTVVGHPCLMLMLVGAVNTMVLAP